MNQFLKTEIENALSDVLGQVIKIKSSAFLGGGCINHASKIETNAGSFFLKWNAQCESDIFLRESESLKELKKAADNQIVIPEVFAAKKVDSTPGFLVLEYLQPRNLQPGDDEKLGRGLAVIHQHENEKYGFYTDNYCGATQQNNQWETNWAVFFRDKRLGFLLNLIKKERPLPASDFSIYEKLLQKITQLIPEDSKPALIHGDLWSGNYMATQNGPALIDPASYFANAEMEFSIITMFGGFSQRFYQAYNNVLPLPPDWETRNKLYQLYHILNHYYLFGGGYQSQAKSIAEFYI